jgi:hypothetical protein
MVGPVGVLLWLQVLVEDRFHDKDKCHLHHAIADGGDDHV